MPFLRACGESSPETPPGALREVWATAPQANTGGWTDQRHRLSLKAFFSNDFKWRYPFPPDHCRDSMNNLKIRTPESLRCENDMIYTIFSQMRGSPGESASPVEIV